MKKVLAIDMGATSIRGILACVQDGRIHTEEVMRLSHDLEEEQGRLRWQWDKLRDTIRDTIIRHADAISSVAIDTWGVDFGCLDAQGNLLGNPIAYRDPGHGEGYRLALEKMSEEEIFANSGTQIMQINTLFQILALRQEAPQIYEKTDKILMLPDLLGYLLCGRMVGEETIWSTSQLMHLGGRQYSEEILDRMEIDRGILPKLVKAGSIIGSTRDAKIAELRAYDIPVVSVCGHDTASAVLLTKAFTDTDYMFLSCGTWSLLGARAEKADLSKEAYELNLTNELGYDSTTLLFQNITGLYLLEKYKAQMEERRGEKLDFQRITDYVLGARTKQRDFDLLVDMDDARFGASDVCAKSAIDACLREQGKDLPADDMEYFRIIYESLVEKYRRTKEAVEQRTKKKYTRLHVIGGGAKSEVLCRLIAEKLQVSLIAGPFEASALGNILLQLKAIGEIRSVEEGLELAMREQNIKQY